MSCDNWDNSGIVGEDVSLQARPKLRAMAAAVADLQRDIQNHDQQIKEIWQRIHSLGTTLEDMGQH